MSATGNSSIPTTSTETFTSTDTSTSTSTTHTNKNKRNMQNEWDEKQHKRFKTIDPTEEIIIQLLHQGISKDIAGIITHLSIPPAVTAFYTLIQYCIKHNPTDADIKFDPVTEDELKIVEDRLGYTLPDDLRSLYLIHRNVLSDHSFSRMELIPRFSTLSNPDTHGSEYKKISSDVIHFADHFEQNTWKLYHCKYGCIMQYCEEPDMDYLPRMLWFSITHLLLSYVHMIKTLTPYWWDDKTLDIMDIEKYREWEEKQIDIICESDNGNDYDTCILSIMDENDGNDEIIWKSVINEFLLEEKTRKEKKRMGKHYLLPWEADEWAQQHRVYDASWDSKHVGMNELNDALSKSIIYK